MSNFQEFENLDFFDREAALLFYENMRAKRDYASVKISENKLDKAEKLLAIDFLLEGPGTLNELNNNCALTQSVV